MSKVEKNAVNLVQCICTKCPSFTSGAKWRAAWGNVVMGLSEFEKKKHFESMYCAFEKSNSITEEKGCICADCRNHQSSGLEKGYFCRANGGV